MEFADSRHISTEEVSCPVGSNFSVRNLFYNVPARRKFLKSDNVEFRHIVDEFVRVALTKPQISFSLSHNGKDIYVLRPAKSLKFRIQDLMGSNTADKVVELSATTSVAGLSGYVCRPDLATKAVGNQFFFVNGRYFRSPYFHKAVMKAYEGLIGEGVTPAYFIYLEVDPHSIDVNIHPTKTEIKFEEDNVIFQILFACVKEALGRNSFGASIDFDRDGAPEMPVFGHSYAEYRPAVSRPEADFDRNYNPFEPTSEAASDAAVHAAAGSSNPFDVTDFPAMPSSVEGHFSGAVPYDCTDKRDDYGKLFEDKTLPSTSVIILQGKYILTQVKSGLLVVNVRRARERIFYERFLDAVSANSHVSQTALFPVRVTVGPENKLIFDEHAELLARMGFDIAPLGNDCIVVNGVPEGFSLDEKKVEALMADVLMALDNDHSSLPGMFESSMAEKFAAIGASCGRPITSPIEAQKLIDTIFGCANCEYTAKGLRTMAILPVEEIDRKF